MAVLRALFALMLVAAALPQGASGAPLRVGTSGDYPPFSSEGPAGLQGFSLTVARAFAESRGSELTLIRFRWPELVADLRAARFDAAAAGVTVRPERSVAGRFSVPVVESGAVVLVRAGSPRNRLAELDSPDVRLVVNRGGHLERVARARFPRADIQALSPNDAVRRALVAGRADGAITDTVEAPRWMRGVALRALGPFTRDRKAWLLRADGEALAVELDRWLLEREGDGTLARWREAHGIGGPATASPLPALFAALDERLALMPLVAETKRAAGLPVEVPQREDRVVEAGVAAVARAAASAGVTPPPDAAVRHLYRAQIEAAKNVQRSLPVAPGSFAGALFDLDTELRPALLRIGERIARLLVALPERLECATVRETGREHLRARHLTPADVRVLADAVAGLRGACASS